MSLKPGGHVASYEIVGLIDAGGMGEVYRARDARLGRDVAIKVLPAAFAADPDRLGRFEQEARAAAALNHPNILAVYDVGQHDGAPYIVTELLEGERLRERSASGLPMRKAIEYAVQIAKGLAAAHDKGIVHRDLKPENIFVTADERVKVLDFGLAKLTQPAPAFAAATGLPTTPPHTLPGVVLGTIGYMSPEQVRGLAADHRSDIFAFGAILYELLAGNRAFRGDTPMDTMTAILKEDPPALPLAERHIPLALERIVARCLEKAPAARFKSADDLAFALEGLSDTGATEPMRPTRITQLAGALRRRWSRSATIKAALLLLLVGVWLGGRLYVTESRPNVSFRSVSPVGCSLQVSDVLQDGLVLSLFDPEGSEILEVIATQDIDLSGGSVADESRQAFPFPFRDEDRSKLRLKRGQMLRIYIQPRSDLNDNEVSLFQEETIYKGGCGEQDRVIILDRSRRELINIKYKFSSK